MFSAHLQNKKGGFTLIEVLLVVAIIAILAAVVILAINPSRQIGETNNAQRRLDVNTILSAVYQYSLNNSGALPDDIPTDTCGDSATEICSTGTASCSSWVDLSVLTDDEEYLIEIPEDPTDASTNRTGYYIAKNINDRVTVCAPHAEEDEDIEVKL